MTVMAEEALGLDIDLGDIPGCECGSQPDWPCPRQAVVNVHIQHDCLVSRPRRDWFLMCGGHRVQARNGWLRCGICGSPDGYRLLAEVPL